MSQEISEHLRKVNSRNGRYWLREMQTSNSSFTSENGDGFSQYRIDAGEELPFGAPAKETAVHESVVVSIPHISESKQQTETLQTKSALPTLDEISKSIEKQTAATSSPTAEARWTDTAISQPQPQPQPEQGSESKPQPQLQPKTQAKLDDAVSASRATQSPEVNESIVKIADRIQQQFPLPTTAGIMFVGTEASVHADETCARVAAELASRNIGKVLLIDSDFEARRLTAASCMRSQAGLSEIMNIALPWSQAVLSSGSSKLDFMPAGNCPHDRWNPKEQLRNAVSEIKHEYQYLCISAGDAHGHAASTWSDVSDGALLVVSLQSSNEDVAESAVSQLKRDGARLIGCVVADVDAA